MGGWDRLPAFTLFSNGTMHFAMQKSKIVHFNLQKLNLHAKGTAVLCSIRISLIILIIVVNPLGVCQQYREYYTRETECDEKKQGKIL